MNRVHLTAGARWLASRKRWVDLYDLAEVRISAAGVQQTITLLDSTGRGVSVRLHEIQGNPRLWDLVYNGIVHSAHTRPMKTNHLARKELKLGTDDLLPPDPGDTGPRRLPTFRERRAENRRRAKRDRPEII